MIVFGKMTADEVKVTMRQSNMEHAYIIDPMPILLIPSENTLHHG